MNIRNPKNLLWVIALAVVVTSIWCIQNDRTSAANWRIPVEYGFDTHFGDSLSLIATIQAAAEGNLTPLLTKHVDRLGAPYEGNWNDYPISDEFLLYFFGLLARFFGLYQATNLAMVLGHVTSAVAFYYCCRLLHYNRLWAWVGAALFSFTYYTSFRGLSHITLGYLYVVPLAVVCSWLIAASKRLAWGNKFCWLCLIVSAVLGVSFPYYLNMYCQLTLLALAVQFFTQRRKQNLWIGLAALGVAAAGFLVVNLDTFYYQFAHGRNPDPIERNYYESEMFALKPMELIIPPGNHRIEPLAAVGRWYNALLMNRGEVFSPYLGSVAAFGLVWLLIESVHLALRRRRQRFPVHGMQSCWVMFYSMNGGLNCLLALAGITIFRASNRFSVFLSAIALLLLVARLSRWSRHWSPAARLTVAAGMLLVGVYDELPRPISRQEAEASKRVVDGDRAFTEKMEAALPPRAMVFQMPVMVFPESLNRHQVLPYDYFRPFINSKTLRFTFGNNKGRPIDNWQFETEKLPVPQMVAALEKYGFAAIYLSRRAFPDRAENLLKQLAAAGKTPLIEDEFHDQICVLLSPSPNPELPPGGDELAITYARHQWHKAEGTPPDRQVWSNGDAQISIYNPAKQISSVRLKGAIGSVIRRRVNVKMDGREIWSGQLNPNQAVPIELVVDAKSGGNVLEFQTDEPASPFPNQPQRAPAAFVLINLRATPADTGRK